MAGPCLEIWFTSGFKPSSSQAWRIPRSASLYCSCSNSRIEWLLNQFPRDGPVEAGECRVPLAAQVVTAQHLETLRDNGATYSSLPKWTHSSVHFLQYGQLPHSNSAGRKESLDIASAFPCFFPGRCSIAIWYSWII